MKLNRRYAGAEQRQRRDQRPVGNLHVQVKLDARRWSNAPHYDDRIIIFRVRVQLRTPSSREVSEMQVGGLGIVTVIQVGGVNVQERRLRKTPQEHGDTEAGTGSAHRLHTLSAARKIVKRTQVGGCAT